MQRLCDSTCHQPASQVRLPGSISSDRDISLASFTFHTDTTIFTTPKRDLHLHLSTAVAGS